MTQQRLHIGIILIFLYLTGCTSSEIPPQNTLTVALAAAPATLDPRRATDATGQRIGDLLFNALIRVGPKLEILGDAAESWTYDQLVYTFKLRPDLSFSDGTHVQPHDIEFTFAEYQKPSSPFASVLEVIKKVEAKKVEKEFIVRLHLKRFSAALLSDLGSVKILPRDIIQKLGDDYAQKLVGTGSYVLKENSPRQIVLEARENHFQSPKSKFIVFKIIQDDATRYLKTLKGAIDIAQNEIATQYIKEFEVHKDFQVQKYTGLSMTYLLLNFKNENLKKLKVRQAMAAAMNRDEIIKYKLNGLAVPATTIVTPPNPYFVPELKAPVYDLDSAKKLLESAGVRDLKFTLKTSNNQSVVENAKVIANQLGQIGIKIDLQSFEWGTYYGDIKKGNFELALMKWVGTIDPDINRLAFHSKEVPPGRNRGSYVNKELDQLLEQGILIENPKKRYDHYKKVQSILLQDLPILPLWYDTQVSVVHSRVKGYEAPVNGDFTGLINAWK